MKTANSKAFPAAPTEEEDRWLNPFLVPTGFDGRSLTTKHPADRAAIEGLVGLRS